jgi:hypothetical protein
MPRWDIEKAYQDRYTLAPPAKARSPPVQWYTLSSLFIILTIAGTLEFGSGARGKLIGAAVLASLSAELFHEM